MVTGDGKRLRELARSLPIQGLDQLELKGKMVGVDAHYGCLPSTQFVEKEKKLIDTCQSISSTPMLFLAQPGISTKKHTANIT